MFGSQQWQSATNFFISAFTELAVLFVVISFLVSVINHYFPPEKIKKSLSGNKGYSIAMLLGAVTPFCSCSTLPLLAGLLKARAAFGPLMAFLITSPLLNPFVISLFWITFGPQVTMIYGINVILMAYLSGVALQYFGFQRFIREELFAPSTCGTRCTEDQSNCNESNDTTANQSRYKHQYFTLFLNLSKGAIEQLKSFLPYMLIGVAIGALLHGFVPISIFESLANTNVFLLIPMAALIGIFLYVRASTMIPIAASMVAKGLSVGAVMSLTIAGAGASLPEMIMLKKMFRWPLIITFLLLVLTTAIITGVAIELFSLS